MKKIHTSDELDQCLLKEMKWRRTELVEMKSLMAKTRPQCNERNVMIRSGIVILYAHWEGFVKEAASLYLNFVAMQGKRCRELTANFKVLQMRETFSQAGKSCKSLYNILNSLEQVSDEKFSKHENAINTGSNLNADRFKEIACIVNIDYSPYELKRMILDEKLLKSRNTVAHGQYLVVDLESYLEVHDTILELMELFKNQLSNSASQSLFLNTN